MIRDHKFTEIAKWTICILAALMFGAFLASPIPKTWAGQVSEMISEASFTSPDTAVLNAGIQVIHKRAVDEAADSNKPEDNTEVGAASFNETAKEPGEDNEETPSTECDVTETSSLESAPEALPDSILLKANRGGAATRKEMDVLIRLINAEAYGLSYKAKVAVGQVVMNRWTGPYYGDDLLGIMTAPHQFTPIYDGSAYKKQIEEDSIKAAYAVLEGTGISELTDDTYYFVNPDFTTDKTIENKMQFVCEMEGIHFFKPPLK